MTLPPTIHTSVPPPAPPAPRSLQPGFPAERALRAAVGRAAEVTVPSLASSSSLRVSLSSLLLPLPSIPPLPFPRALSPLLAAGRNSCVCVSVCLFFPSCCCRKSFSFSSGNGVGATHHLGGKGIPRRGVFLFRQQGRVLRGRLRGAPRRGVGWGRWVQAQPPDVRTRCGVTEREHRHPALPSSRIPRTSCSP